jgi:integrase/recombinase XerC
LGIYPVFDVSWPSLKKGGTLEKAPAMGNHASTRTMQLYDQRRDKVTLDEVERIVI